MTYFSTFPSRIFSRDVLQLRRSRPSIAGFAKVSRVSVGDVLALDFQSKGQYYNFKGLCIGLRKKNMHSPESALILRNVLDGVAVEFTVPYYYLRLMDLRFEDYKRKSFSYDRSKLFHLRHKVNKHSRVK